MSLLWKWGKALGVMRMAMNCGGCDLLERLLILMLARQRLLSMRIIGPLLLMPFGAACQQSLYMLRRRLM